MPRLEASTPLPCRLFHGYPYPWASGGDTSLACQTSRAPLSCWTWAMPEAGQRPRPWTLRETPSCPAVLFSGSLSRGPTMLTLVNARGLYGTPTKFKFAKTSLKNLKYETTDWNDKTLFSKWFELNQLWIQTKSELTNSNYPRTHPTKLQSTFKQSMEILSHQSSSSTIFPYLMKTNPWFALLSSVWIWRYLQNNQNNSSIE